MHGLRKVATFTNKLAHQVAFWAIVEKVSLRMRIPLITTNRGCCYRLQMLIWSTCLCCLWSPSAHFSTQNNACEGYVIPLQFTCPGLWAMKEYVQYIPLYIGSVYIIPTIKQRNTVFIKPGSVWNDRKFWDYQCSGKRDGNIRIAFHTILKISQLSLATWLLWVSCSRFISFI